MFRYTIRDVLWLTVVVALGVLWWGEYRQRGIENAELWATTSQLMEDKNAAELEADNYRKELAALKSKAIDGLASVAPRVRRAVRVYLRRL